MEAWQILDPLMITSRCVLFQVLVWLCHVPVAVLWFCEVRAVQIIPIPTVSYILPGETCIELCCVGRALSVWWQDAWKASLAAAPTPDVWRLPANLVANGGIAPFFSGENWCWGERMVMDAHCGEAAWSWGAVAVLGKAWAAVELPWRTSSAH